MRILLVDDDEMDRKIFTKMIRSAGHEVIAAASGQAAITAATAVDFDLIMMDQKMPDMDGTEATRRIRAIEGPRGQVPVVSLSGTDPSEAQQRDARMDGYLNKDRMTPDRITKAIEDGISARRERSPPAEMPAPRAGLRDGLLDPRTMNVGLMLSMVGMLASGIWYMASQAADARHLAESEVTDARRLADALIQAHKEAVDQQAQQALQTRQISEGLAKLDHDQTALIYQLDNRVGKLEAQMSFVLGTGAPAAAAKR